MTVSRRDIGVGALTLAGLGVFAAGYHRFAGPWYASTPYDDLLHQIVDRAPAARLGQVVTKTIPHFNVAALAEKLRQPGFALERRARSDAAAGRVIEANGWIVPETVALYAALAAQFA